jgi:hypothetical protein
MLSGENANPFRHSLIPVNKKGCQFLMKFIVGVFDTELSNVRCLYENWRSNGYNLLNP